MWHHISVFLLNLEGFEPVTDLRYSWLDPFFVRPIHFTILTTAVQYKHC
jgi:hypothetical protein